MILLDTCAILWDALEPGKLTTEAKRAIERSGDELIICDISLWEIAMLISRQRLVVENTISGFTRLVLQARDFRLAEITPEIAELSVSFGAEIGKDPVDRLIAATSIVRNAPIVTADRNLRAAGNVVTIW